MGVVVDGFDVVIRNSTIERLYPGGVREYERNCPNATFCTDGRLCRVSFMMAVDRNAFVEGLFEHGFAVPTDEGSPEVGLLNARTGYSLPCDWLEVGRLDLGDGESAMVAWPRGTRLSEMVAPPGWRPGLLRSIPTSELSDMEFLGSEGRVESYRSEDGKCGYVARTEGGAPPASLESGTFEERLRSIQHELNRFGGFDSGPRGDCEGALRECLERAERLAEDTDNADAGPLLAQAIACRLLERWDEAARHSRRVTELAPECLSGWLELTWALISLRCTGDAERAAREALALDPEGPATLGNLALVLLEQGRVDEAHSIAVRALDADPEDVITQNLMKAIERRKSRERAWWRRLLGRSPYSST